MTKARNGFFVAWDGEGRDFDEAVPLPESLFQKRGNYLDPKTDLYGEGFAKETKRHSMTLFACYGGGNYDAIHDSTALSTEQILSFIGHNVQRCGALAIHVSFSFSYDATHILKDLPREELVKAHSEAREALSDYGKYGRWLIKYRPRKELYICELADDRYPYKVLPNGKKALNKLWSVIIWDVWGFFQSSFLKALQNWGVGSPSELLLIQEGKEGRKDFAEWDEKRIEDYNAQELVLLCNLMEKVREATNALELPLQRWDGAGAIAAALFKKELPKDYIKDITLPKSVQMAAYYAYAGGRSECVKQGTTEGAVFRYDINSAYPDAMRTIPDLSYGEWIEVKGGYFEGLQSVFQGLYIEDFALYHISWYDDEKSYLPVPFLPFFWRDIDGTIYYPPFGENWVWGIELKAALRWASNLDLQIHKALIFKPFKSTRPFAFIERYYEERLAIKQRIKNGQAEPSDNGRSLIIKLGLNSLYGKTVQKVGIELAKDGSITYPPFYNIAIGSYITAYTRAKLYSRAMQGPEGVCLFATDGILTTAPLGDTETSEKLGEWECEALEGLILLQAGVYWTKKDGRWSEKSRGIDKALSEDDVSDRRTKVLAHWAARDEKVVFPLRRFITAKWASLTAERYPLRGNWLQQDRDVNLWSVGKKREALSTKARLWERLYRSVINWSVSTPYNEPSMSEPRKIGVVDVEELEWEEEL